MDYIEVLKNSRLKDIVWLHTSDIWGSVVFKVSIIDWSCNCIFESISHLFVRKQNKCKNSSRECKQIHIKHLNLVSNIYTTLCIESYKTPRPTRFGKVVCLSRIIVAFWKPTLCDIMFIKTNSSMSGGVKIYSYNMTNSIRKKKHDPGSDSQHFIYWFP